MTFDEWWLSVAHTVRPPTLKASARVAWEAATKAERERCAQIVETHNPGGSYHIRTELAAAIRQVQP